ncbi:hypothetical protein LCGC14_0320150 [marine sediment metagenome]|uniref:Uncharacterized protein n=1 Tax=marine sediment metagenome TaxID=412755 RepID=A0A0F9U281_9ZZZZ
MSMRTTKKKSLGKSKKQKSLGKPLGATLVNWPEALARRRRGITDPVQRQDVAVAHRKLLAEFDDWKRTIQRIIQTESELDLKDDDSYSFVLPPQMVRICYEAMLKQYMNAKRCERNQAVKELRDKLEADHALGEVRAAADAEAEKEPEPEGEPRARFVPAYLDKDGKEKGNA